MTEAVLVKTLVVVKSDHTEHAGGGGVTQEGAESRRRGGVTAAVIHCVCVCVSILKEDS